MLPAVGATASDPPEFLWRVVNLFLKVREVDPEFLWLSQSVGSVTVEAHPEFLWRVVNLFPKVRACNLTVGTARMVFPVAFPVVQVGMFGCQIWTQKDCPRFYWLLILTGQKARRVAVGLALEACRNHPLVIPVLVD